MKMEMTKREKILIFTALVILIGFVSIRFVIMPLRDAYDARLEEYENLSLEREMLEIKFINEDITRLGFENAQASFDDLRGRYPEFMSNPEIDRVLTGICVRNGLTPVSLSIRDPVGFGAAGGDDEDGGHGVRIIVASMTLNGGYDSLQNLIAAVERTEHVRIVRLSFSFGADTGDAGRPNTSVVFEVTMIDV